MSMLARRRFGTGWFVGIALVALTTAILFASNGTAASKSSTGRILPGHTPGLVQKAKHIGPEDTSRTITVTLWLKMHNQEAFDELVRQLYDKSSRNYHHWLTREEIKTHYMPKDEELATVKQWLAARNLKISKLGDDNFYVEARGTVGDVQRAFNVQIHKYELNGKTYRANTADPRMEEPVASLVETVDGLHNIGFEPNHVRPVMPNGKPAPPIPLASAGPDGLFFSGQCFRPVETDNFNTGGGLPTATYTGNRYGADINSPPPNLPPCGYDPAEAQTAYGLNSVYGAGFDGTGQTVVIVDAFGSPTIRADAETFSQVYGLPDLTPSNFKIHGLHAQTVLDPGWATETTLDVEWAHAVAPGANIYLVVAKDNSFSQLGGSVHGAIVRGLGTVISNSYGAPEGFLPAALLNTNNNLAKLAASMGINLDFSSGDNGDWVAAVGFQTVNFPSSSPFVTSIGGTSLALNPDNTLAFQEGWGTNATFIFTPGFVADPPQNLGFIFGSGGGPSGFFAKPAYQSGLPGSTRQQPDISYLADPFTGVEVICDGNSCGLGASGQFVFTVGGTSVACPMFSGLWAIASQAHGGLLGQGAPLLYSLPAGAITDVVPVGSANNVTGSVTDSSGTTNFTADQLAGPLQNTTTYFSGIYNQFDGSWFVLVFGTDSSLVTATGWDNVTGLGTPNGLSFVQAVAGVK